MFCILATLQKFTSALLEATFVVNLQRYFHPKEELPWQIPSLSSHTRRGPRMQIWHSPKAALGSIPSCFCLLLPHAGPSNPCYPPVPLLYFSASLSSHTLCE